MPGQQALTTAWQDACYTVRLMRRAPGFTAIALLSLGLGTGANTAIFSLVHTLTLRDLPVLEPARLVEPLNRYPGDPAVNAFSGQSYEHFRDRNHVFAAVTGATVAGVTVRGEGFEAGTVNGESVAANYFATLGVKAAMGRLIGPGDAAVAVVSWWYWNDRLHRDPAVLGRRIFVDETPVTVIGVLPREFLGLKVGARTDVWLPRTTSDRTSLYIIARLKPGVSVEQARAEMAVLYRFTIEERSRNSQNPLLRQLKSELEPAGKGLSSELRDRFARPLLMMMAVVGVLLLIACTNVAAMLLARGAARQREMAIRVALGAGRSRLVRQVLTESVLLAVAGSLAGALAAWLGARALAAIMMSGRPIRGFPPHIEIPLRPDAGVLLFAAAVALLTGVLFGLAPARQAFVGAPATALRGGTRAGETRFGRHFGKSLVVAQVALSVVLMSAAGLFVSHLASLQNIDLGFQRDHVLLVSLNPARSGYSREQLARPYQELLARMEAIPGVRSASLSAATPLSGAGASRFATVEGFQERPEDRRYLSLNWVAPKFFETLGTPLLAGRDFTFQDQGRRVAIVNRAFARHFFGGGSPLGKHFTMDGETLPYEIVGMVGNANYYEIREVTQRTVYCNAFQEGRPYSQFELRTGIAPAAVAPLVRRVVRDTLKTVPVTTVTTLEEQVNASILPERLIAAFSGVFGALGAVLAAIGLYGLLAYTVARRVNEVGVRMALGATRGDVLGMVLRDALGMAGAGVAIGAPAALWGRRFAASLIQDLPLTGTLPVMFAVAAMLAVAFAAAYLPARRAAAVDPMQAIRYE